MDEHPVAVAIAGYLTVLLQVAFPFVLFGRLKYPVLIMLVSLHLGIAVLLGLPIFSGVMIVADAVFLPDRFYRSYPGRIRTRSDSARAGRLSQAARRTREPATGTVTASAAFPDDAWHVTGREGMTAEPRRRARTPVPTTRRKASPRATPRGATLPGCLRRRAPEPRWSLFLGHDRRRDPVDRGALNPVDRLARIGGTHPCCQIVTRGIS